MQRAALRAGRQLRSVVRSAHLHIATFQEPDKRGQSIRDAKDGWSSSRGLAKALQMKLANAITGDDFQEEGSQGFGSLHATDVVEQTLLALIRCKRGSHDIAPLDTKARRELLEDAGTTLHQVSKWAGVLSGPPKEYLELWRGPQPPPVSVLTAILNCEFSAEELRDIITTAETLLSKHSLDEEVAFLLCHKLLIQTLLSWPSGLMRAASLFPLWLKTRDGTIALPQLSMYFNRLVITLATALPGAENLLSQAQFMLVKEMSRQSPPVPLSRRSYRALVYVQLLQPQSQDEQDWARLQAPTWPPYKTEEIGIQTGSPSRALFLLRRMLEAGFAPHSWERQASIFAGMDSDGFPTIQNSNISQLVNEGLSVISHGVSGELAARVRSTRSSAEAYAIFKGGEKRDAEVYLAMFEMAEEALIPSLLTEMKSEGFQLKEQHVCLIARKCSFELGEKILRRHLNDDPFNPSIEASDKVHNAVIQLLCRFSTTLISSPIRRALLLPEYMAAPRPAIVHAIYLAQPQDWHRILDTIPKQLHLLDSPQKYNMSAAKKEWQVMLDIVKQMQSARLTPTFQDFAALCRGLRRIRALPQELKQLDHLFTRLTVGETPLAIPSYAHLHSYIQLLGKAQDYERLLKLLRWMISHASMLEGRKDGQWRAITAIRVAFERGWYAGTGIKDEQAMRVYKFMEDAQELLEVSPWTWPSLEDVMLYNGQRVERPVNNTPLY